jgi:hypothetical protein
MWKLAIGGGSLTWTGLPLLLPKVQDEDDGFLDRSGLADAPVEGVWRCQGRGSGDGGCFT